MSIRHLQELGDKIIKAVEGNPLKTEIAMTALESMNRLLSETREREPYIPDPQPYGFNDPGLFVFEDQSRVHVLAQSDQSGLIWQSYGIPFLFHHRG